jgi:hypothetical protein
VPDLPRVGPDDEYLEDWGSTGVSTGTSVTAGTPANTKGASYTELVAATSHHAVALSLYLMGGAGIADFLVDVAIGAAGAEQPIVENLLWTRASVGSAAVVPRIPIVVPQGARLSARCQSTTASSPVVLRGQLHAPGVNALSGFSKAEGIGVTAADSGGTGIDGGAVVNTKGAYAQLILSTANPYRCLYVLLGNQNQAARVAAFFLVDIAVGPATETVIIPNLGIGTNANEQVIPQVAGPFFMTVPAGTRLTARCQCSGTTDLTQRDIDVALLGVY